MTSARVQLGDRVEVQFGEAPHATCLGEVVGLFPDRLMSVHVRTRLSARAWPFFPVEVTKVIRRAS